MPPSGCNAQLCSPAQTSPAFCCCYSLGLGMQHQTGSKSKSACSTSETCRSGGRAQGDGTAQLLCRDAASQAEVCGILTQDLGVHCMPFTVPPTDTLASPADSALSAEILGTLRAPTPQQGQHESTAQLGEGRPAMRALSPRTRDSAKELLRA